MKPKNNENEGNILLALPSHLEDFCRNLKDCELKEEGYNLGGKTLTGWYLPTKHDVFCFYKKSRAILLDIGDGRKYAHPKGVELTPVVFLSGYGIVKLGEFSEALVTFRRGGIKYKQKIN